MTKPVIIGNLSKAISNDEYEDKDEEFWKETLTYVHNDGVMEAQGKSAGQKCYDDRIMDTAILLWIHTQLPLPTRKFDRKPLRGWRREWEQSRKGNLIRFAV
jgi:hypothetical protein